MHEKLFMVYFQFVLIFTWHGQTLSNIKQHVSDNYVYVTLTFPEN